MSNPINPEYGSLNSAPISLGKMDPKEFRILRKDEQRHEETMEGINNDRSTLEQQLNLGLLGKLFGGEQNSSKNITALINICLLLGATAISLVIYFSEKDKDFVKAIWTGTLPIVTLSLGYLFGKK